MGETSWSHDNKEWQKTLDLARELGWPAPAQTKDHPQLILHCPGKNPQCKVRIYSTGEGTETVAISSRRKVRNCSHRDLAQPLVAIKSALDGAERMLDAADKLLNLENARQSEQAVLDALESLAVADERLAEVDALFEAAVKELADASTAIDETVAAEDASKSAQELTNEAGSRLRTAKLVLRDQIPKRHAAAEAFKERHAELSDRLKQVRSRLRATPG